MKRSLWALCLAFALFSTGCAAFWSAIPTVVGVVQTTTTILEDVTKFVDNYLDLHPDPVLKAKFVAVSHKVSAALGVVEDLSQTTVDIHDANMIKALTDVQNAWEELLAVVAPTGVTVQGTKMSVSEGDHLVVRARLVP